MASATGRSARGATNTILSDVTNSALRSLADVVEVGDINDIAWIADVARSVEPSLAVVGPEGPLESGAVDTLLALGIPCFGPTKALARIETSKGFARSLIEQFRIGGNPAYRIFADERGLMEFASDIGPFVVKPDGLTGGKGVRVWGDHFMSLEEGLLYCRELFTAGATVVIEEKLEGEEFSLQSFCDGKTIVDMIPVQDHKRLLPGDRGPNTGGMGSYSCADHSLPFLTPADLAEASRINRAVAAALRAIDPAGVGFRGVLYGNFIATKAGPKVIEYNARFGDPEVMNILALLEADFVDVCRAVAHGRLQDVAISFRREASVCKYAVPRGYPSAPELGVISVEGREGDAQIYFGNVDDASGPLRLCGGRAIASIATGENLEEAERRAEEELTAVRGPVVHRVDIGTTDLIAARVDRMNGVRSGV